MKTKLAAVAAATCFFAISSAAMADDADTAKEIATLFRSARAVISANQAAINDPNVGDKGLTGDAVVAKAKENYKTALGKEVDEGNAFQAAELKAIKEVMDENQALINEKGKGFKGFIPAVFAGQVAAKFSASMEGKAKVKLTAPEAYIRNRKNRPDEWESNVIETKFKAADYKKDEPFSEMTEDKGQSAFRFIIPEYYAESCLGCHGEPKGDLDITGGKKEGGKLGELGGAVSVTLYK